MNSNRSHTRLYVVGCLAGLAVIAAFLAVVGAWAANERGRPDYLGYDLSAPWFDGKYWAWFLDMFNGPGIKPQEVGTFQSFPSQSVPRSGVEPEVPPVSNATGLLRDQIPPNPTPATPESIANGRRMYVIYCGACHGLDGKAQTPIARRGMPAVPIDALRLAFTEPHLYNKIRYGQPIMPAYGFQTTQQERWDIVNYLKSQDFGK